MASTICIDLAGLAVSIESSDDTLRDMCAAYITDREPQLTITVSDVDVDLEYERYCQTQELRGEEALEHSRGYLESLSAYRQIADTSPLWGIFLTHGSCIAVDGRCYMFTAPSGTGKSTHARLWREALADTHDVHMINDDKPLLRRFDDGTVLACGTPWDGKEHLSCNMSAPLCAIGLIEQADSFGIECLSGIAAFEVILSALHKPQGRDELHATLDMAKHVSSRIPVWRIRCTPQLDSALSAIDAMGALDSKDGES